MPVDPQIQAILDRAAHLPGTHTLSVAEARARYDALVKALPPAAPVAGVAERSIAGPGGPLTLRIYTPPGTGPFPMVVFFHGSGFVLCSLDTHDGICRNLCGGAGVLVVSVDYRLAPEHRFPAAPEDCLFATRWAAAHAAELGADPARIAVAGDSAGGNLAAVLSLMARDGALPTVAHQALFYPVTDIAGESPSYGLTRASLPLTAHTMRYFIGHYAPQSGDRLDWRASPLRAPSVEGVAPALVLTVGHDPLRDEGQAYARRLDEAGVRVCAVHLNDQVHGLFGLGRLLPAADRILDAMASHIGSELRRAGN